MVPDTFSNNSRNPPPPLVVANYIFRPWCPSSNLWLIKWWVNTGGLDFKDNLITNFMSSNGVQQVWFQYRGGVLILYTTMAAMSLWDGGGGAATLLFLLFYLFLV